MKQLYAEDVGNYWKTGTSAPDTWIDKAKKEIRDARGSIVRSASVEEEGRAAFLLEFSFSGERFRAIWPVLPSKTKNERAARIQAATMLYHDVKARCVSAKVLGARAAFFTYLLLPDGRIAAEAATPELSATFPRLLTVGPD